MSSEPRSPGPAWHARHRRIWIFLVAGGMALILLAVLIFPLVGNVPDDFARVYVLAVLGLWGVYAVIGCVNLFRVYRAGYLESTGRQRPDKF